ncbi:MAG: HNH endonuclease signature motif containing protein [Candidatus Eisenbacteria bacterium]
MDLEEKSKLAEGLALIALVDRRRDFLEAGYSSMHAYCTGQLHMSDEQAYRRISVARLGARVPLVFPFIADGRLTVTNACELASVLTPENAPELLAAATFKSKLEVRRLVLERTRPAPKPAPPAESVDVLAPAQVNPQAETAAEPAQSVESLAPAQVDRQERRGRVTPQLDGSFEVRLALTPEEHKWLRQAQDLLAHVVRDGDPAVVIAQALEALVEKLEKKRYGAKPGSAEGAVTPRGRHIPPAMRRHVADRDGRCCTFVGAEGHRCGETRGLQFDHIVPLALGGTTSAGNLRMLCAGWA